MSFNDVYIVLTKGILEKILFIKFINDLKKNHLAITPKTKINTISMIIIKILANMVITVGLFNRVRVWSYFDRKSINIVKKGAVNRSITNTKIIIVNIKGSKIISPATRCFFIYSLIGSLIYPLLFLEEQ